MIQQRLGPLPDGWYWARFGDVATLINGRAYSQPELLNSGTPVLRIQNLNGGTNWYYSNLTLDEDKYCEQDDLLFAWSATFGPYWWTGPRAIYHYHIWKVVPSARLHKRYAYYALGWLTNVVRAAAHGITMVHMTKAGMEDCRVPLPPLSEQRRIADILDKADAVRRKRKEAIALTEELLRSAFLEMFGDPVANPKGWPVKPFADVAAEMKYGTSEKCSEDAAEDALPVLRIPNIVKGSVAWDDLKYACLPRAEVEQLRLERGDMLFVRSNGNPEYIGRCAVYASPHEALFASYLIRVRLRRDAACNPNYVQAAFSMPTYRGVLTRAARTTAGNYNISTEGLRRLLVPIPPSEVQAGYVRLHEKIVLTAGQRLKPALDSAEQLFDSLVARAFRGELTRSDAPSPAGPKQLDLWASDPPPRGIARSQSRAGHAR